MNTTVVGSENDIKPEKSNRPLWVYGRLLLIMGLAFGILLVLLIFNRPYRYQGSLITPPLKAYDFQIKDQYGESFTLSEQVGNVVLIFFGYTHCTDVCPVTMYEYKQLRELLGERANNVRFVFITVDPERDTPQELQKYINNFDPEIVGLSDGRSVLEDVWQNYGVAEEKVAHNDASDYTVDHSSRVYVIDKLGFLRMTYPFGFEIEKVTEDIDHLLREDEG